MKHSFNFFLSLITLLFSLALSAQEKTISGTVTDVNGMPLPGVNILIQNSSRGTQTNFDGEYTLQASPGETLVFSFIGMKTIERIVDENDAYNIVLEEDSASLDEVIVVGYGSQSKRNVTGSVSSVDVEQLENQPNTNIGQALRGRVSGVQFTDNGRPGQAGNIVVRGQTSITGSNDPLIVLDGAFYNGQLSDINPNDIESMEVLKDASAAAIYGSRAANGVILITSRSGLSAEPTIRFNSYVGVSDWSNKMPLYTPEGYLQRRLDFRSQNQLDAEEVPVRDLLNAPEREMYDAGNTVDPWEEVSQDALQQSYNVSVSGRTERTNYFISGSYVDEEGLIYGDNAKRTTFRINIDNEITNWLKVGVNSQFTQRDHSGRSASLLHAYWLTPYGKMYFDEENTDPVPYPTGDNLVSNPMFNALTADDEEIYNNLFANFHAEIDIPFIKGLSYRFNYNPNLQWDHHYTFEPIYQRNGLNNPGTGTKYNRNRMDWQLENIVSYTKDVGDHAFDLTLLYGRNHTYSEGTSVEGRGFVSDVNSWDNLDIAETQIIDTEAMQQDGVSSMARLNYRFQDRYLVTLTARRDGSSVFGSDRKFGTFPSAAIGWIISDEAFMQNQATFEMLKLRTSYGEVGNQAVQPYRSLSRSSSQRYVFGEESYTGIFPDPAFMANPDLGWETTKALNVAVDFNLWQGRFSGTLEYYNMITTDLLLARSLPAMSGFESTTANLGQTSNNGLEVTLNTVNVRNENFDWTSNITFSTNRNRIDHLYNVDSDGDGIEDNDVGNRWFIDQPIGVTYDYVFDGIYQIGDEIPSGYQPGWVRVKDLNNDGQITPDDRTVLGQTQPKYRWGFQNDFKYKDFSLSFFINAMTGWEAQFNLLDVSSQTSISYPGRSVNMLDAGYWTPENRSNTRPGLTYTNPLERGYYLSRDFIRLQDVTLAYEVPQTIVENLKLDNLRIYLSGRNLITVTDWLGPDPETWQGSEPESGENALSELYPTSRTIICGVNVGL